MDRIFVDTGAWYASVVADDENHEAAKHWLGGCEGKLFTTDYIIDELLTLLGARGARKLALRYGYQFFVGQMHEIHHVSSQDVNDAWEVFRIYNDKEWSFTDCVSRVVMRKMKIRKACSFDQHFRQFGDIEVFPY